MKKLALFIRAAVLSCTLLYILSCSESEEKVLSESKNDNKITAPQKTIFSNLPDSNKPKTIAISRAQLPKTIIPNKQPETHLLIDPYTHSSIAPEGQGKGFFTTFTTDDGLLLDGIVCSAIDKKGNLWFGTNGGGVSRYDGKNFTNYNVTHGLVDNLVNYIMEDRNGNLWFATLGGVSRYDGKIFTNFTTSQGLSSNQVSRIKEDKSGNLWFGTQGAGVSRYDGKNFTTYTTAHGLADNTVWFIGEDKRGNLWIGTNNGISCYDGKGFTNFTTPPSLSNRTVTYFTEDRIGNLWFGTYSGGVVRYDGKNFKSYSTVEGLVSNVVSCITEDNSGNIWIGTWGGGISRYNGKGFTSFTVAQGLASNTVSSIVKDKRGSLWIGTFGGGISRYDGESFIHYTKNEGLGENLVYGMVEDKDGDIWFGTTGGGVTRYDGKSFENYSTSQGLVSNGLLCIIEDRTGNLWFGTNGNGVSRYDGKKYTNYTSKQGLCNNTIWCIAEDKAGNIWFGTSKGVSCYNQSGFTNYTIFHGLAENNINCILVDKAGKLWFGTNKGVSCFDGESFTNFTTAQGLANNVVWSIEEDKNGNLWFGTNGGGISRYDGKSFFNYTIAEGLPDNSISNIVFDSASNIVFGTNSGIGMLVAFIPNSRRNVATKSVLAQNNLSNEQLKLFSPQIEIYNSSTGYPIKDLNTQAMITDSKGNIWIGTGAAKIGLVRFNYSAVKRNVDSPLVIIQNIKVNNENISWYNLLAETKRKELVPDSNQVAPNVMEELTTLGKKMTQPDRDSMRSKFRKIKFDSVRRFYPIPENLVLPYDHNNITIDFMSIETMLPKLVKYQYFLEGYDGEWSSLTNRTSATYGNIREGTYKFKLKAQSPFGIWSEITSYTFKVLPPWWRTWWAYTLYAIAFLSAVWAFIKWRTGALKKEKILLEKKVAVRTHQLQEQKEKVESTLSELKSTQSQLIQSEKMASLGELTAGIAHEIQNPLNFVNNFSEINTELADELLQEAGKGNLDEIKVLAKDIKDNEQKINHHGKRADAIVKGMLQHSRSSSGKKEPTDINKLADEYLKLAYHGLRAKDSSFNASMNTDYDETIGSINIIPQDIGRVILNLINNAFYAVDEKKRLNQNGYEPTVSVGTKKIHGRVQIIVGDNGNGIPQNVVEKIFQPFFTTKPTGEGTGLGLSLSYDIVKAHGGELKVETKEGLRTEFIVNLPI